VRDEAKLVETGGGLAPSGHGWFVVNTADAQWWRSETFGWSTAFESQEARFGEVGVNLTVLDPGQPACMYHGEEAQEDFLVLFGECRVVIEGEDRQLRAWDFVHCPPWVEHVFVGAGDGPCGILMIGARKPEVGLLYPVNEPAATYGASVAEETPDPKQAYAPFERPRPEATADPRLPWNDLSSGSAS
jgi:uncharacterized cupin superfamily protein